LNDIDTFTPSGENLQNLPAVTAERNTENAPALLLSRTTLSTPLNPPTIAEKQSQDGDDVLALLSQPAAPFEATPETSEILDWGLSHDQMTQLRGMLKELFPPVQMHDPNATSSLDPENHEDVGRQQWEVLVKYTDEVWGDLLPLVKEARRDLKESDRVVGAGGAMRSKALKRLQAVLEHLGR
jgi:hypothetical protein